MVTRYGQADVPREVSGRGGPAVRPAAADFPRDVCLTVSRNHAVFLLYWRFWDRNVKYEAWHLSFWQWAIIGWVVVESYFKGIQPVKRIKGVVRFIITLFSIYWTINRRQINSIWRYLEMTSHFRWWLHCVYMPLIGDSWPVEEVTKIFFQQITHSMIRDGSMTKPCLPRVAAQPQMTLSFFKPYLSPRWRYCDVMTQLDKTPQWPREDHLRHGNRDNGSDSRGYGVTIRSHWWPLVTLLYLMCW